MHEKNLYGVNDLKFSQAKKLLAAAMLGAFAFSIPMTVDARMHDPKLETKSVERKLPTLRERVAETMHLTARKIFLCRRPYRLPTRR